MNGEDFISTTFCDEELKKSLIEKRFRLEWKEKWPFLQEGLRKSLGSETKRFASEGIALIDRTWSAYQWREGELSRYSIAEVISLEEGESFQGKSNECRKDLFIQGEDLLDQREEDQFILQRQAIRTIQRQLPSLSFRWPSYHADLLENLNKRLEINDALRFIEGVEESLLSFLSRFDLFLGNLGEGIEAKRAEEGRVSRRSPRFHRRRRSCWGA